MVENIRKIPANDMTSPYKANGRQLWEARGLVPEVRAVMGLRFTQEQCEQAAPLLISDVFNRIGATFMGQVVLEIGTGIGRFTTGIADRAALVVGVDLSRNMLDRTRTAVAGRDNVKLLQASATDLPVKNNVVNGIFEFAVLVHIVNDFDFRKAIEEAKRVLAPGGTMVLCGQLSRDNNTHMINPQFIHRPIEAYEQAVRPLTIAHRENLESLGEKFSMLFIR